MAQRRGQHRDNHDSNLLDAFGLLRLSGVDDSLNVRVHDLLRGLRDVNLLLRLEQRSLIDDAGLLHLCCEGMRIHDLVCDIRNLDFELRALHDDVMLLHLHCAGDTLGRRVHGFLRDLQTARPSLVHNLLQTRRSLSFGSRAARSS